MLLSIWLFHLSSQEFHDFQDVPNVVQLQSKAESEVILLHRWTLQKQHLAGAATFFVHNSILLQKMKWDGPNVAEKFIQFFKSFVKMQLQRPNKFD